MKSTRWMLTAALAFGAAGCKKDSQGETSPATPATEAVPSDPAAKAAEPAATGAVAEGKTEDTGTPPQGDTPEGKDLTQPIEGAKGDLVAVGASGKAKVVATGKKVLADTPTYTVSVAAPGSVGTGAQGTATLEIVPKPGWKLNHEFPTKLTVAAPAGVAVKKPEQTLKDAVSFGDKLGTWAIDFTADSAGDKAFGAKIKFAVCTEVSCDPKKEELAWNVNVQ